MPKVFSFSYTSVRFWMVISTIAFFKITNTIDKSGTKIKVNFPDLLGNDPTKNGNRWVHLFPTLPTPGISLFDLFIEPLAFFFRAIFATANIIALSGEELLDQGKPDMIFFSGFMIYPIFKTNNKQTAPFKWDAASTSVTSNHLDATISKWTTK